MSGFDPNTAQPVPFDPTSAKPVAFDPSTASPIAAPVASRPAGAQPGHGMLSQMVGDLFHSGPADHDPNALEQGAMDLAGSKQVQYLQGVWNQNAVSGLFAQPTRAAMEGLGIGRKPGESDDSLHQRYGQALTAARQQAQQQITANKIGTGMDNVQSQITGTPHPTLGDRAARVAQQVTGIATGIAGNPQYALIPGMGIGSNVAARVAVAGAGNAAVGAASDGAAQVMDMAEGQKKQFDIKQNLESAAVGGLFGAGLHGTVEVAPFVASLFGKRGIDTTPQADPRTSTITPMTQDHIPLNQADGLQYKQLLQTGSVDDIKGFFRGRNGPQPSWTEVNDWIEHRDNPPAATNGQPGVDQTRQPDFDYTAEHNANAEQQWQTQNRQAVEDHVTQQMSGWKNAPNVEVVHSPNEIADPAIRDQVTKEDPNGDALGVFGADGKLRVFSGRITDPETANAVLYHEGLGHFGLAEKFGDRLDQTLQSLLDRNVNQFSRDTTAWQKANPDAYGGNRLRAAEEVLAERSEAGKMPGSWQDAVSSSVRQFGRKMGLKLAYSDAEVNHILAMSHDAVVNGKPSASANGFRGATQDPNKFMFIGKKANGFDPNSATADMARDGEFRNEISDKRARLYDSPGNTLGSTLYHPELFERYPELRDIPVEHQAPEGHEGAYWSETNGGGKRIAYNKNGRYDPVDVVLHESQHAIQDIEQYPDFVKADQSGGTSASGDYHNHPSEVEARTTEARRTMTDQERIDNVPAKFMRKDALGREQTDTDELDMVDRLKADPRYWTDREYRQNVNELARTRFPADGPVNKFITQSQLNRSQVARKGFVSPEIEDIAQHIEDNYQKSTVSDESVRTEALRLGISPKQISELATREPGQLSVRLARIGAAADMAGLKVKNIVDKLDTPEWKPEDHVNLAQAIAERNYLVERFKGESSEIGRAQRTARVFQSYTNGNIAAVLETLHEDGSGLASLSDPTNPNATKFARQLKQMLANGNPAGAGKLMSGVNKPYWEQYLTTFHMNMMLSALSTHVKAPIDMATGITRNVVEKALAMPVGKVRQTFEAMTGKTVQPGVETAELANHLIGIMRAVSDAEVYRQVAHAVKTGESSYVVGGKATPTQFANKFGAMSNPRIPVVSKMTDLISAQDTFFRSVEMNAQLETVATREARAQLGPKASTSDVMTLGHSLATNPTPTMLKDAFAETNRTLLLNDNPINSMINKARTYRPGMNAGERAWAFIVSNLAPFIRVESNNLINRVIQRSPLGLVDPTGYTQAQLKAGGAKADIAVTKMLYGTVLIGMVWAAADKTKNYLTGEGPTSVDKYKSQIAGGWRPNAVHEDGKFVTGGELGMSVNPFDYHNKTAQMVASMRQAYEEGANKGQVGTGLKMAFGSMFSNLAGMSWISDIQPAVDAARAHGTEGQSQVSAFASKEAGTWLPNGLNQAGRLADPVQRDTTAPNSVSGAMGHEMMSEIPGLRQQLPIKYSVYGTPLANGASLTGVHTIIPGLSGNGTTETHDPAERELDRLNSQIDSALVTPVQHSFKLNDDDLDAYHASGRKDFNVDQDGKVSLTPAQFEELQHVAGRYIVDDVRQEMSTPEWQKMSDQDKVLEVRAIEKDQKANAREALFNK